MKVSSLKGKEFLTQLKNIQISDSMPLASPFSAIAADGTQALCVDRDKDVFWQFALYWLGVHVGDVCVEIKNDLMLVEEV
jgi:hypothetical protein